MKHALLLTLTTALLAGCGALTQVNSAALAQGKPIGMWTSKCEGYVVQSGLPIPVGQRMEELDALCPGKPPAKGTAASN